MEDNLFRLRVNHGGKLIREPARASYLGGTISMMTDLDPDRMSYFEIINLVRDLGHSFTALIWYLLPLKSMSDGLQMIDNDQSVLAMFKCYSELHLYEIEIYVEEIDINVPLLQYMEHTQQEEAIFCPITSYTYPMAETDDLIVDESDDETDPTYLADSESSDDDDAVVSDFNYFAEDDRLSDTCDPVEDDQEKEVNAELETAGSKEIEIFNGGYESDVQSDPEILTSPQDSDDDNLTLKFPQFDEKRDMANPTPKVGLLFVNVKVFRKSIREYAIRSGFELDFLKNERHRVTTKCKEEGCTWRIHASLYGTSTSFQIKSLRGEPHICPRKFRNTTVDSNYLANKYLQNFVDDPSMTLNAFKKMVKRDVKIFSSRMQLYRAKAKALEKIQGNVKHQYFKIRKYANKVLETNPGSTAIVKVEGPPIYRAITFQRFFVMFVAQRDGFIKGCRHIIGLDACFLKGSYGGQLMAAIGRDGNNQMFPLAVAVVEAECKQSWSWFLQALISGLRIEEKRLTFISDRQKGLVETFKQLMPTTEHRYCVRHLYANFKLKFSDIALKDLMWAAARSYQEEEIYKEYECYKVEITRSIYVAEKYSPRNMVQTQNVTVFKV